MKSEPLKDNLKLCLRKDGKTVCMNISTELTNSMKSEFLHRFFDEACKRLKIGKVYKFNKWLRKELRK